MTPRATWMCALLAATPRLLGSPVPSVGVEGVIELDAPHADLRAVPADEGATTVVRIVSSVPLPDGGTRYRIAYAGFEAGEHNLAERLATPDGAPLAGVSLVAGVRSVLPPGDGLVPEAGPDRRPPRLGGYRAAWAAAGLAWLAGWVAYAWRRRPRRVRVPPMPLPVPPPSPAERLRALLSGDPLRLDVGRRAELERLVLASWRSWAGLDHLPVADALSHLRRRPESGAALSALDAWLHRRDPVPPSADGILPPPSPPTASSEPSP